MQKRKRRLALHSFIKCGAVRVPKTRLSSDACTPAQDSKMEKGKKTKELKRKQKGPSSDEGKQKKEKKEKKVKTTD